MIVEEFRMMRVKCVLCDVIEKLDDESSLAKKLRNRPIHTYMCMNCNDRIKSRTNERIATDKFKLYRKKKKEDDWW
jgi:uncharacterized protein YlaI